jgi:hypothetical protein
VTCPRAYRHKDKLDEALRLLKARPCEWLRPLTPVSVAVRCVASAGATSAEPPEASAEDVASVVAEDVASAVAEDMASAVAEATAGEAIGKSSVACDSGRPRDQETECDSPSVDR